MAKSGVEVASSDVADVTELEQAFAFQGYIERTEHRAITLPQLQRILAYASTKCSLWRHTMGPEIGKPLSTEIVNLYHLNEWAIKPATKRKDCAFVELLTHQDQPPTWFASHWWGEPILHFVNCVDLHCKVRNMSSAYWVCAYANRQHSLESELLPDLLQTSFFKALLLAKGVLLVLNEGISHASPATPFTRIWCIFEEHTAIDRASSMLLDITATCAGQAELLTDGLAGKEQDSCIGSYQKAKREKTFPLEIIRRGLSLEVEKAQASEPDDLTRILNHICGRPLDSEPLQQHDNYSRLNCQLRSTFAKAAWLQALEKGMVDDLELAQVLAEDTWRKSLCMDFAASCEYMTDHALATFGQGLPGALLDLQIDLGNCSLISNVGIAALAGCIPTCVEKLWLRFYNCSEVGDTGVEALAASLAGSLTELTLNFNSCKRIGDAGLTALASGLPNGLAKLVLYFAGCDEVGDVGVAALGHRLPRCLKLLELSFVGCTRISSTGVASISAGLTPHLEHLELHFLGCEQIEDAGVASLRGNLPSSLQTANLRFYSTAVSEATLALTEDLAKFQSWHPSSEEMVQPKSLAKAASQSHAKTAAGVAPKTKPAACPSRSSASQKRGSSTAVKQQQEAAAMVKGDLEGKMHRDNVAKAQNILSLFKLYDTDKSGYIEEKELLSLFKRLHRGFTDREIRTMFASIDVNHDGKIDYHEFIGWLLDK